MGTKAHAKVKEKTQPQKTHRRGKFARRVARRCEFLKPQFPDIEPHDLELIVAALLRTPKQRMQHMFLKKREDGRYVF
jgi:hypothetical protein